MFFNCFVLVETFPSEKRDCNSLKCHFIFNIKNPKSPKLLRFSSFRTMATLRNKRKLAAVLRDTQESARKGQSQNTFVSGMNEGYITQMSEEIERRFSRNMSQEFSLTESCILGDLSKLDEFILNPQVRTCSGSVPGSSWNNISENQEPTGDGSPNDLYPKVESLFVRPALQLTQTGKRPVSTSFTELTVLKCWKYIVVCHWLGEIIQVNGIKSV